MAIMVSFENEDLKIGFIRYRDGSPAILLKDNKNWPCLIATTWIKNLSPDEVAIENCIKVKEPLKQLIENKIVYAPHKYAEKEGTEILICKVVDIDNWN